MNKGAGLWSPSFKSKVARWAYSYCTTWLSDGQWEAFKRSVGMDRTLKAVYGGAIKKQLEMSAGLLDKFRK